MPSRTTVPTQRGCVYYSLSLILYLMDTAQMAQAGFVYTPQTPGDDTASCLYCNISLSGWELEDEPM